jgi:FMN reductase
MAADMIDGRRMLGGAATERRIAVVAAGLSQPSSTRMLADRIAESVVNDLDRRGVSARVDTIELRDIARDVTNNLVTGFPSAALAEHIETVIGADGLIAVTPIFTTSYSGLFKSFFDILDPKSLTDMPVLIGATGGSERHSLALDYAMRPLFTYLHGIVVPTAVYAASSDWGSAADTGADTSALQERIDRAASELGALVAVSDRSSRVADPFELSGDFGALLGGFEVA